MLQNPSLSLHTAHTVHRVLSPSPVPTQTNTFMRVVGVRGGGGGGVQVHAYGRLYNIQCGVENKLHCCGRERERERDLTASAALHTVQHSTFRGRADLGCQLFGCSCCTCSSRACVRACVQLRNFPSSTLRTVSASTPRPLSARVGENCVSGSGLNCPSFTLAYYNDNILTTPQIRTSHIIPTTHEGKE